MNRIIARLTAPKTIELFEESLPPLGDDEVLAKTISVGLCHSEMPNYFGKSCLGDNPNGYRTMCDRMVFPVGIGHEPVAIVQAVGKNVTRFHEGDYVTGRMYQSFTNYLQGDFKDMVLIPDTARPIELCLGEPFFCIANILQAAAPQFGDSVAVVGCGFMGLLALAGLSTTPLKHLVAIDVDAGKEMIAKECGATHFVNPSKEDAESICYDLTNGSMFDTVIEITGSLRGLDTALRVIRIAGRGKILLGSVYSREEVLSLRSGYNLMTRSPILHSTHPWYCSDYIGTMEKAVDAYTKGMFPMEKLVTHRLPIEKIQEGFSLMEHPTQDYIKGMITFA